LAFSEDMGDGSKSYGRLNFEVMWIPTNVPTATTTTSVRLTKSDKGQLCVRVKSASNVPDMDGLGAGLSDPFVKVTVGKTVQQTPKKANTLNPVWNWESSPCFKVGLTDTHVKLSLWDYDKEEHIWFNGDLPRKTWAKAVSTHDDMGFLKVLIHALPRDRWKAFSEPMGGKPSRSKAAPKGKLSFELKWMPAAEFVRPIRPQQTPQPTALAQERAPTAQPTLLAPTRPPGPGKVCVKVKQGKDLPDMDGFGAGLSDPFVEVIVGKVKKTTPQKASTLNPVWNWESCFTISSDDRHVDFAVWDFDKREHWLWNGDLPRKTWAQAISTHDTMGSVRVIFRDLAAGTWKAFSEPLRSGSSAKGRLDFDVMWTPSA